MKRQDPMLKAENFQVAYFDKEKLKICNDIALFGDWYNLLQMDYNL